MRKAVRLFKQNASGETCVCCCILMILDYYRLLPGNYPTRRQEENLYKRWGSSLGKMKEYADRQRRFVAGTPLTAAACCLSEFDLSVRMVHSEKDLIDNTRHFYPEDLFPLVREQYLSYMVQCQDAVRSETGVNINCDRIAEELDAGQILILMLMVPGSDGDTPHAVVADKYREQDGERYFHFCDPYFGRYEVTDTELEKKIDVPFGRGYIAVKDIANVTDKNNCPQII
ncbi:MAG: hypothetical protein LUI87_18085 [Lachnospiraceae bacterium]|nr:hypothetical protein [Lachnospiraceae bacterium]